MIHEKFDLCNKEFLLKVNYFLTDLIVIIEKLLKLLQNFWKLIKIIEAFTKKKIYSFFLQNHDTIYKNAQ